MLKNGIEITGTISDNQDISIDYNHSDVMCQNDYVFINRSRHPIHQITSIDVKGALSEKKIITINNENFYSISGSKTYTINYRDIHRKTSTVVRTLPLHLLFKLPLQCIDVKKARLVIYDLNPQNLNEDIVICNVILILYLNLEFDPVIIQANENNLSSQSDVSSLRKENEELEKETQFSTVSENTIPDIVDIENFYLSEKEGININSLPKKNIIPDENLYSQISTIEIDEEFM